MGKKLVVPLRDVAAEMDLPNDEWTAYLNRRTGELVTVTDEEARAVDSGVDEEDLPAWQAELLPKVREALESEDFLPLPSKHEIHEYQIVERFCAGVPESGLRDELLAAIRGRGAFARFKSLVHERGIVEDWYRYRDEAIEEIAAAWLDEHGIAYTSEASRKAVDDA